MSPGQTHVNPSPPEAAMPNLRLASLLLAIGVLLIPTSTFAQQEKGARTVRLDEGINVRIAPVWQYRQLAPSGATKLELTVAEGSALRMAVYVTVERRRNASDALQRASGRNGVRAEWGQTRNPDFVRPTVATHMTAGGLARGRGFDMAFYRREEPE